MIAKKCIKICMHFDTTVNDVCPHMTVRVRVVHLGTSPLTRPALFHPTPVAAPCRSKVCCKSRIEQSFLAGTDANHTYVILATLEWAIHQLKCAEENFDTGHNIQAEKQETSLAVFARKEGSTMYAIVDFDDGTEIVPLTWLEPDKKKCKWPPYTDKTRITEAISKRITPPNDWETYGVVKIRATTATLDAAILELKYAEKNSDTGDNVQAEKQETLPAVSAGKNDLDDQNNPTQPMLDTLVKRLDDLTKLTEKLLSMQTDTSKSIDLLTRKVSTIEESETKPVILASDKEELKSLESVVRDTEKIVPEIEQNVDTKSNIEKELPLLDKDNSEPSERKLNYSYDENDTKPLLPVLIPKDEKEDHQIKMTEKLLPMQTDTSKSMDLLEKRMSKLEDNISKPVIQQNVTTRYDTKKELPVLHQLPGKLPVVRYESICTSNLQKSASVETREMRPTIKQTSQTPLDIKEDLSIFKKKNLSSSFYQTDDTLLKYSPRAEGSSDFEMTRYSQHYEPIRQTSSSPVYHRTTQKHDNFVRQPVASQPVTALPGIGRVLGQRLASAGYSQAHQVREKFISMGEDRGRFQAWLHSVTNANSRQSADCYYGLYDWE